MFLRQLSHRGPLSPAPDRSHGRRGLIGDLRQGVHSVREASVSVVTLHRQLPTLDLAARQAGGQTIPAPAATPQVRPAWSPPTRPKSSALETCSSSVQAQPAPTFSQACGGLLRRVFALHPMASYEPSSQWLLLPGRLFRNPLVNALRAYPAQNQLHSRQHQLDALGRRRVLEHRRAEAVGVDGE